MLPTDHAYELQDFATTSLKSWVNTVVGEMVAIDRMHKLVRVRNQQNGDTFEVPYDHLILATGIQFQVWAAGGWQIQDCLGREIHKEMNGSCVKSELKMDW